MHPTLETTIANIQSWGASTFTEATVAGTIQHLRREAEELRKELFDRRNGRSVVKPPPKVNVDAVAEECADVVHLAAQLARLEGKEFPDAPTAPRGNQTPASLALRIQRECDRMHAAGESRLCLGSIYVALLHLADLMGFDLAEVTFRKFLKNQQRTWKKPDAQGVIEHATTFGAKYEVKS